MTLNGDSSIVGLSWVNDALYGTDLLNYPGEMGTQFDLGEIDPNTGVISHVNDQDGSLNWHGLASNESTGELYAIDNNDDLLLKVTDSRSGLVTAVGTGTGIQGHAIVFSAIDNLVKGASGQAVHNMNIMYG